MIIIGDQNAVRDAGRSLIKLIWDNVSKDEPWRKNSGIDSEAQIVLSSPESVGEQQKLSIFLYRVDEDGYLSNPSWEEVRSDSDNIARFSGPSLGLRLFYMITPHDKEDEVNHIIMGKVMQIFNDNPLLKAESLQGSLSGQEVKLIFTTLSIDDLNKIWGMISRSKPYMPSLYYEISGIVVESSRTREAHKVTEVETLCSQKDTANAG